MACIQNLLLNCRFNVIYMYIYVIYVEFIIASMYMVRIFDTFIFLNCILEYLRSFPLKPSVKVQGRHAEH